MIGIPEPIYPPKLRLDVRSHLSRCGGAEPPSMAQLPVEPLALAATRDQGTVELVGGVAHG
jgi:hypothetical protein